ncbi:MAG: hypothetical protein EA376_08310 [Phycisphaeraceae bacterium]|nr:MAG: hypothetical protein EA376_08310 [Phycisphaeraceae bacterium]
MHIEDIRKASRSEPFRPFTVNLADGRSFRVQHPEFIAIPPQGRRTVIVFLPGDEGFEIIDPTMVASLTVSDNGESNHSRRAG